MKKEEEDSGEEKITKQRRIIDKQREKTSEKVCRDLGCPTGEGVDRML